jgi:hypothetical protein
LEFDDALFLRVAERFVVKLALDELERPRLVAEEVRHAAVDDTEVLEDVHVVLWEVREEAFVLPRHVRVRLDIGCVEVATAPYQPSSPFQPAPYATLGESASIIVSPKDSNASFIDDATVVHSTT